MKEPWFMYAHCLPQTLLLSVFCGICTLLCRYKDKNSVLHGISNDAHVQFTPLSVVDCTLSFGFELQDLVQKGEVMLTV